ncbi:MAG: beta-agarase [Pirellulaceae bacterium]|nr:beta-agarase [Pirellulaceae bacterium]
MNRCPVVITCIALLCLVSVAFNTSAACAAETLLTIDAGLDLSKIEKRDVQLTLGNRDGRAVLSLAAGHQQKWPGITIAPAAGPWDLSAFETLTVPVRNTGAHSARFGLRADSPDADGKQQYIQAVEEIAAGQQKLVRLPLQRRMPAAVRDKLFGMRGYPGQLNPDSGIDVARVTRVQCFVSQPDRDHTLELGDLQASGQYDGVIWLTADPDRLFPMIDRFGQYMHSTWPGKTVDEDDLRRRIQVEDGDLASHPGPAGRNQYGGWSDGPQLDATGHFRATKRDGKWWLVDPEGRLFWSHGIDCVRAASGTTPISDREFYFADLPEKNSPLSVFYGRASWAPHGYYKDKGNYQTFNFTGSNLHRKYGEAWRDEYQRRCHVRLRSWGLNSIGNWSDPDVYLMQQTPYVVTVNSGRRPIEGSTGYWGKFPDPFDPSFAEATRGSMAAQRQAANSPWCLGVFVDNELAWGEELSLALATLASPPQQAAKQAMLADLKAKYDTIAALNEAWGTSHASWQALGEHQQTPDPQRAKADLEAFATRIADEYFKVCREAVKQFAPETLYLGCRFAWVNDRAIHSAGKYCDVIGFNKYRDTVADFRLPDGVDLPAIIGEFHFGALDRGMFHPGLRKTANQQERADAYLNYVRGAVQNPWLVGTHWFQFGDQATTGRGDGENYQIGFLDICDSPYPEIIAASRQVGAEMYGWRSE